MDNALKMAQPNGNCIYQRKVGNGIEQVNYSTWRGRRYLNQYRMGRHIGKGTYSNVRIATNPLGERVAVKYYFKTMCASQRAAVFLPNDEVDTISVLDKVYNEIELHKTLQHANIGKIIEVLEDTAQQILYVIMEFLPAQCMTWDDTAFAYTAAFGWTRRLNDTPEPCDLIDGVKTGRKIRVFTEPAACHFLKELIEALSYLKSMNVVHKDIKPDNAMLSGYCPSDAIREIIVPPLESLRTCETDDYYNGDCDNRRSSDGPDNDNLSVGSAESDIDEFLWSNASTIVDGDSPCCIGETREQFQKTRIADVKVKLIDFNTSVQTDGPDHLVWDSEGTRLFTPPECFMADRRGGVRGCPRDIWSLGCLLYCFVFGRTPFWASIPIEAIHEIQCSELKFPQYVDVSQELIDLLRNILEKDPEKRYSLEDIRRHPWTTNEGEPAK